MTNSSGECAIDVDDSLQNTQFEVYPSDNIHLKIGHSINLGTAGNLQIRVGLIADPSRPQDIILPAIEVVTSDDDEDVKLESVSINGLKFLNQIGDPIILNGLDMMRALRNEIDGVNQDALIEFMTENKFNMARVWAMSSVKQNGMFDLYPQNEPNYWGHLTSLTNRLNDNGIVLFIDCFVDNQDIKLDNQFWLDLNTNLRGTMSLISGGNEWSKNGFYPPSLPDPANGNIWSRGSDVGDMTPVRPIGPFNLFHPRRDFFKSLDDSVASADWIYHQENMKVPLVVDEPPRMGFEGSAAVYEDPNVCWQFARNYFTMCAGAVFHNRLTMNGNYPDELTKDCMIAWSEGLP